MDPLKLAKTIIKHFEGLRLLPYDDETGATLARIGDYRGTPTIGWGHAFKAAEWDEYAGGITADHAEALLDLDLRSAVAAVEHHAPQATSFQKAALIDFTFNLGSGALAQLLAHEDIAEQLGRWDHAGGREVAGLTKRRAVETFVYGLTPEDVA